MARLSMIIDDDALVRWLRHAVTSGEGVPSTRTIGRRFGCSWRAVEAALGRLELAGTIQRRPRRGSRPTIIVKEIAHG